MDRKATAATTKTTSTAADAGRSSSRRGDSNDDASSITSGASNNNSNRGGSGGVGGCRLQVQQRHQQHRRGEASDLCTGCQSRIDTVVQHRSSAKSLAEADSAGFRILQSTMPLYAVSLVRQHLLAERRRHGGESSDGGKALNRYLEARFGGAWNVIVGEEFAASVIYGANSFLHCVIGNQTYLLFSWQPVSLFNGWSGQATDRAYS